MFNFLISNIHAGGGGGGGGGVQPPGILQVPIFGENSLFGGIQGIMQNFLHRKTINELREERTSKQCCQYKEQVKFECKKLT